MTNWQQTALADKLEALPQARTKTGRAIIAELRGDWTLDREFATVLTGRWLSAIRRNEQTALRSRAVGSALRLRAWHAFANTAYEIRYNAWGIASHPKHVFGSIARWHEHHNQDCDRFKEAK